MSEGPSPQPGSARRTFILKALNFAIGGAVGIAMAVPIVRYLLFPTSGKIVEKPDGFIPVAKADAVKAGAPPVRVQIVAASIRDAWSKIPDVALGAAWLVRDGGGRIRALSTTCPHLGCAVDFDATDNKFRCPCHTSAFDLAGDRLSGPTKRGMYVLDSKEEQGRVLVRAATDAVSKKV
jgi:Rieske Fe-S protein